MRKKKTVETNVGNAAAVANQHVCPNCGYCPHCGRGPAPFAPQPIIFPPNLPYVGDWPGYQPTVISTTTPSLPTTYVYYYYGNAHTVPVSSFTSGSRFVQ